MRRICVWKCENEMQIKLADVAQRSPEYSGWNASVKMISRLADVPISRGRTIKYRNIEIRRERVVCETQYFTDDLRFNPLFH